MKKLLLTAFMALLTTAGLYAARQAYTTTIDGVTRKYVVYTPGMYQREHVVILLHGIGETYDDYDSYTMQSFATNNRCVLILPQALPEQDATLLALLDIIKTFQPEMGDLKQALEKSAWGANVYITIDDLCTALGISKTYLELFVKQYPQFQHFLDEGKIQINKDVNDNKFIDEIREDYSNGGYYDTNIIGCSLGGAMAYNYAFEDPSKVKGLVDASGFVSKGVTVPSNYNIPTFVIHSKTDEIIPYDGGLFSRPTEDFVKEMAGKNTHSSPEVSIINEDQSEDKQIEVTDWKEAPEVLFYSVNKASHTLIYDMANLGVDVYDVIGEFLFHNPSAADEATADSKSLTVYPNPVEDIATVNKTGNYSIINMAGVTVSKGYTEGVIDMTSVNTGRYILTIETENTVNRAIIIKK